MGDTVERRASRERSGGELERGDVQGAAYLAQRIHIKAAEWNEAMRETGEQLLRSALEDAGGTDVEFDEPQFKRIEGDEWAWEIAATAHGPGFH